MRYLSLLEVLELHEAIISSSGGSHVVFGILEHLNLQSISLGLHSTKPISIRTLFKSISPLFFPCHESSFC